MEISLINNRTRIEHGFTAKGDAKIVADQLHTLLTLTRPLTNQPYEWNSWWKQTNNNCRAVAKVNGSAIELRDLVALEEHETEKTMTAAEYASRLDRAIEIELTFQAATVHGVELSAQQQQRLNRLAQQNETIFTDYRREGITWSSVTQSQLELSDG